MGLVKQVRLPMRVHPWILDAVGVYLNRLCEHEGELYGLDRTNKKIYRWDALGTWTELCVCSDNIYNMCSFNGNLYVSGINGSNRGLIYRLDEDSTGASLTLLYTALNGTHWSGQIFNFDDSYLYLTEGYTASATVRILIMDSAEAVTESTYTQSTTDYPQGAQVSPEIYSSRRVVSDGSLYRDGSALKWQAPGVGDTGMGLSAEIAILNDKFYGTNSSYLAHRDSFAGGWYKIRSAGGEGVCVTANGEVWSAHWGSSSYIYVYRSDGIRVWLDHMLWGSGAARWISYFNGYLIIPTSTGKVWRRVA